MLAAILLPIPLALPPIVEITRPTRDCALEILPAETIEERTIADFQARLDAYVTLQRRLTRSLGTTTMLGDDEGDMAGDQLRAVLVAARPLARQGEFFTPSMADVVAGRVDRALLRGVAAMPVRLYEPLPGEPAPAVNNAFPFVAVSVEWPALFRELPALPPELGYALWGRDLVLVDVDANLFLDVLIEALPEGARPGVQFQ
jgi:hypothetical protein